MHFGRSHHIITSILGGFAASFLTFTVTTYTRVSRGLGGQLLAGDPAANRELPTTLNMMKDAADGTDPTIQAMSSYGFWIAVTIGTLIAAPIVYRLMRRFV